MKKIICWSVLQQIVINTADEFTGKEERIIRNGWFDEDCTEATKIKRRPIVKGCKSITLEGQRNNIKK
jgi:hypothetical protein